MYLKQGQTYTMDSSDLSVYINKVCFRGSEYCKVKLTLTNKNNGIVYETAKNYKLYLDKVKFWEIV